MQLGSLPFHSLPSLQDDFDPTAEDENLRRKLEQQVAEGNQKIDLVLQEYVEIQADGRQGRHDTPGDLEREYR